MLPSTLAEIVDITEMLGFCIMASEVETGDLSGDTVCFWLT